MFRANPSRFIDKVTFNTVDLPIRMPLHRAAELIHLEKTLNGYCPVSLVDEERVVDGVHILLVLFAGERFIFANEYKLQRFMAAPWKYAKAKLPVKMPPEKD